MNLSNWQTQLRKGLLDIVIVNLLRRGKCHGYEMVRILKWSDALTMREGNIHSILARLQTDGSPRKYFELTELGEKTLIEMNAHWDRMIESIRTIRKDAEKGPRKARNGRV